MTYQVLTEEQFNSAKKAGFTPDQIIEMEKKRKAEMSTTAGGGDKNLLQKIGNFVAPTATKTFEKMRAGEDTTLKEKAGSLLDVGSWLVPTGAVAKGIGLGAKGLKALSTGQKMKLGSAIGGTSGAMAGAARAMGDEESTAGDIFGSALGTGLVGTLGGAAIPGVVGAVKGIPGAVRAAPAVGKAVAGVMGNTPARIASRAQEKVQDVIQKQQAISKAAPHIKQAIKEGIDEAHIKFLQTGSKTDKAVRAEMLDIAKKATDDLTFFDRAVRKPGEQLLQGPVKHLIDVKDKGVQRTKKVLDSLADTPQNARNMYDQFIADMQNMGVRMSGGRLVTTRGSRIPEGDLKFYNEVLRDLMPNKKGVTPLSYKQMHAIRQKFYDVAEADSTFTSGPVNYARALRARLASEIDKAADGAYINAQIQTRESLDALRELVKFLGYKGKLEDISTKDLKAGESLLRLLGNASDRPNAVLDEVYKIAQKYKYKGDENIKTQLRFADMLRDIYGEPSRSLAGQMSRAGSVGKDPAQVAAQGLREMVKWSPYSGAINLLRKSGLIGGRPEDLLKAFEDIIRAEAGRKIPVKGIPPARSLKETFGDVKKIVTPPKNTKGASTIGAITAGGLGTGAAAGLMTPGVETYTRAPEMQSAVAQAPQFDREDFTQRIVGIENEALAQGGGDLYTSVGVTGDLGKYQVNPDSLKEWSKFWLDKVYTPQEFLNDPQAQEEFFNQFLDVVEKYALTPEEAAVAWHTGWGELGKGEKETREERFRTKLERNMQGPAGVGYLAKFNR